MRWMDALGATEEVDRAQNPLGFHHGLTRRKEYGIDDDDPRVCLRFLH